MNRIHKNPQKSNDNPTPTIFAAMPQKPESAQNSNEYSTPTQWHPSELTPSLPRGCACAGCDRHVTRLEEFIAQLARECDRLRQELAKRRLA